MIDLHKYRIEKEKPKICTSIMLRSQHFPVSGNDHVARIASANLEKLISNMLNGLRPLHRCSLILTVDVGT
jgi:hypothetical protein